MTIRPDLFRRALAALQRHGDRIEKRDRIALVDFDLPSSQPRFHIVDLASGQSRSLLVAHGRGSDPGHTGWLTRFSSKFSIWWDTWIIDGAVRFGSFCVKLLSYPVCLLQSGRVQTYALFVVVGFLAFLGYYVTR